MLYKNIFISYSWDGDKHQNWVKLLADRLEEIFEFSITFDQYDLDSFSDKNHFMEKAVFDTDLLLPVITEIYREKANGRTGGVGIETAMATSKHWEEILTSGKSNIIPILVSAAPTTPYLVTRF